MTTNNNDFWYDENCPCNGCPSEGACMLEKLACEDFLHYAGAGAGLAERAHRCARV